MIYVGVDPGKKGGIGCVTDEGQYWAISMPDNCRELLDEFYHIAAYGPCFALLEKVHSSPQMGVKSAFTFGEQRGQLLMSLCAAKIPFEEVTPSKWQKEMKCLSKGDKKVTKAKAQQLFPEVKVTHLTADSLLIAEYCRRYRNQGG